MNRNGTYLRAVIPALTAVSIFLIDARLPRGTAAGLLYVALILILVPRATPRELVTAAIVCSLLTVLAAAISPPGAADWIVYVNRLTAIVLLWLTVYLGGRYQHLRNLFEFAWDAAPVAMIITDARGRITRFNAQALGLFGYSADEFTLMPVDRLVPGTLRDRHQLQRADFYKNPQVRKLGAGRDLVAVRRDGTHVAVEIGLNPIRNSRGLFVLSSIVDITRRKEAEDRLAAYAEELKRRNKELDEFSYMASHDLQEPLRKLTSFGKLLAEDVGDHLPEPARADLKYIEQAAERMRNLVEDLLALSRAGKSELNVTPVPLESCIDDALGALSSRIEESNAKICVPRLLPVVLGDRRLLTQLFQNLIGNALKFTSDERPPVVEITVEPGDETAVIGVRDNGIGIKDVHRDRIFEPFRRLHSRDKYGGTGIGLSICRKIVERHGGRLWVESLPGQGSHFRFSQKLPRETQRPLVNRPASQT